VKQSHWPESRLMGNWACPDRALIDGYCVYLSRLL
jgi:hypothetical protein